MQGIPVKMNITIFFFALFIVISATVWYTVCNEISAPKSTPSAAERRMICYTKKTEKNRP